MLYISFYLQGFQGARCRGNDLLDKPVEQLPPMGRQLPVETEGVLVQIEPQVLGGYIALMGAVYPPLQQGIDHMYVGQ